MTAASERRRPAGNAGKVDQDSGPAVNEKRSLPAQMHHIAMEAPGDPGLVLAQGRCRAATAKS
jgi:hypothetical protein